MHKTKSKWYIRAIYLGVALAMTVGLLMVPAVAPVEGSPGGPWYVDGSVAASGDGLSWLTAKKTIGEGITAASDGDTINVAAGTYNEHVVTTIGVKLIGSGSGVTTIAPSSLQPVLLKGWDLTVRPLDGFRLQGFTLVTADENHALLAGSGTPDGAYYTTNLELDDIVVNGGQRGIGLNSVGGAAFTNVHLSNISSSGEGALELTGVSDLLCEEGSFENNDIGVRLQPTGAGDIGAGYGPNDNIQLHCCDFSGNCKAIENLDIATTTIIDARRNWWGHESGPSGEGSGSGDSISTNVDFSSWLPMEFQDCEECLGAPSPSGVPTVNHWGIVAMTTLFAGLLVWTVRRRRLAL